MFLWTFASIAAAGIAVAIVMGLYLVFYVWYFMVAGLFGVGSFDLAALELSLGIHGFFLATWVVSVALRFKNKIEKRQREDQSQNLFVEYVKAKKQKICPIIEFEE